MSSPSRQAHQVRGPLKDGVLGAIPPHVWGIPRRRHRRLNSKGPRAPYIKPGPSPLRHSFTLEDLLWDASRAAREPRYSNPFNNQPCQYHYLFPPGSPYESWNPKLGVDFWPRVQQYYREDRSLKDYYLFLPGTPCEICDSTVGVHSRNVTTRGSGAGDPVEKSVVDPSVGENNRKSPPPGGAYGHRYCLERDQCVLGTI